MHFTPTSTSWLNLVERWFREIAGRVFAVHAHQRRRPGRVVRVSGAEAAQRIHLDRRRCRHPGQGPWRGEVLDVTASV
jgi:hypothetical protein